MLSEGERVKAAVERLRKIQKESDRFSVGSVAVSAGVILYFHSEGSYPVVTKFLNWKDLDLFIKGLQQLVEAEKELSNA